MYSARLRFDMAIAAPSKCGSDKRRGRRDAALPAPEKRLLRRRLLAEPLLVDRVVRAVRLGLLQDLVDLVQQGGVALLDTDAVLLVGLELGGDLGVRELLDVV